MLTNTKACSYAIVVKYFNSSIQANNNLIMVLLLVTLFILSIILSTCNIYKNFFVYLIIDI